MSKVQKRIINIVLVLATILGIIMMMSERPIPKVHAQEAQVVVLDKQFRLRAEELHYKQMALDDQWESLRIDLTREYLEANQQQSEGCVYRGMLVRLKWGCSEFQYSEDYKSIVPKTELTGRPSYGDPLYTIDSKTGAVVAIKEKPDWEIDQEGKGFWSWNNEPNSETSPRKK